MYDRKAHSLVIVIVGWLILFILPCGAQIAETPKPNAQLGMNLAGPCDWNTELPFVDVFRMSRKWISQEEGKDWGKGPDLDVDKNGWVTQLKPNCWADTPLCTIEGGHYPEGRYAILYEGEGKLDVWGAASVASQATGRMEIDVNPSKGGFFLKLVETNPENYIRNIRVIMPGFLDTYRQNPWHPVFLKRWKGVACVRFMDWMHTNGSTISNWSERPTLEDATYSTKGIPLELMIDVANRLKADAWFCIPHLADDEYVREFATLVKKELNQDLKIYIEYSNEVWNGIFSQHRYAAEQGKRLGFAEKDWEAAWRYTAYRSVQIFRIWEEAFGDTKRLIRVLPTQAANPYVSERILEFQDAYRDADALAIAPYISVIVSPTSDPNVEQISGWTVEQVLDYTEDTALPRSIEWIRKQKQLADEHDLKLIAYEAGQHLVGTGGGENNEKMTRLFHEANRHPRMGGIYRKYYEAWEAEGGDLLCHFSSIGRWSKWGSWGLMQYYNDNPADYPKYKATIEWAKELGQPVDETSVEGRMN